MRLVIAVLALGVVLGKAAVQLKWIDQDVALESSILVVGGILVFLEAVGSIWSNARGRQVYVRKGKARKTVAATLQAVSVATGLPLVPLGGSVYIVRRRHWWTSKRRLCRLVRYRLSDSPQPSAVDWTMGKGAIGQAWAEKRQVHKDNLKVSKRWGEVEITEAKFETIPPTTRGKFSHDEFRGIVGKYSEILATPIWSKDKVIGVFAIDIPSVVESKTPGFCLKDPAVDEIAANCASVLSGVV